MKNDVELLGFYGGDKTHCLSAWTSTFKELDIEIPENIENRISTIFDFACKSKKKTPFELLIMLGEAGHHTPFEKSCLHFMVNTDIASHIHIIKHRIGVSVNTESARYKELQEDKYYLPEDWNGIKQSKDVLINHHIFQTNSQWTDNLTLYVELGNKLYHQCLDDLTPVLGRKRAKESARFFKTYNSQVTADVMFNFRSFMHFQGLRNSEHAQLEIREIAQTMLKLVKEIPGNPFEHSLKGFGY